MTSLTENRRVFAETAVKHGVYRHARRLSHLLDFVLGDTSDVETALDIGGGYGLLSFYLATQGASSVVCLEPEDAGSTAGVTSTFEALAHDIDGGERVELRKSTFQDYDPGDTTFDLVVSANAVNHLNEPACVDLKTNPESYATYIGYFQRIHDMMNPGGRLILTDCSPHNLFGSLGLTNPFLPTIEWEKHQSPWTWRDMLAEVGFVDPDIRWTSLNALGRPGRLLMDNPVVAWLTLSHFRLEMRRP